MSREIKFRIWDIVHECYLPESRGMNDGVLGVTIDGTGIIYLEDGEVNVQLAGPSGVIIERDTGLKDKNGKEIYEGDIVKARDWDGDWRKYRIKWKQSHCAFEAFKCGKFGKWNFSLTGFIDIEVIGNIHENAELLGGEE